MTDNAIKSLAKELANKLYNDNKSYNTILWWGNEPKEHKAEELEHTLQFLLQDYCIVEKNKAANLCRLTLEHGDSVDYGLIDGLVDIVCDIFSEQYHQEADKL